MKRLILFGTVFFFFSIGFSFPKSKNLLKVDYVNGTVMLTNGNLFELSDGSVWSTTNIAPVRSSAKIVIILNNQLRKGAAFIHGKEIYVEHVSGNFTYYSGYYTKVVEEAQKGAVLYTEDGSNWIVPDYERLKSSKWQPPYNVIITSDELFMLNLDKNKRIIISGRSR